MTKLQNHSIDLFNSSEKKFALDSFDSNHSFYDRIDTKQVSPLDKLAQLESEQKNKPANTSKSLAKRAKAKYFTNAFSIPLAALESPLQKSYNNTIFGCSNVLIQQGQKITSTYCGNRWCVVCNRIRTAKMINSYTPALNLLKTKYFVTLTIPNVPGSKLKTSILDMIRNFQNAIKYIRKNKVDIIGLRKLECTYNPNTLTFHPHFHLIVDSELAAKKLIEAWLLRYPAAREIAQDFRPADDNTVMEMFKYFTKIATNHVVHVKALDIIFQAMRNLRVYQPFGIAKVSEEIDEIQSQIIDDLQIAEKTWTWLESDWVDKETGELLTNYKPDDMMITMCKNIIT